MPLFLLKVKFELENIALVQFNADIMWKFDIESESGEVREGITFSKSDEMELSGSKGTANFVMKWDKASQHQSYIKIVDVKKVSGSYTAEQSGTFVTVLGLECRGIIPRAWIPGQDCSCESSGGKKFPDVDLSEGDWTEYDDESDLPISITDIAQRLERS